MVEPTVPLEQFLKQIVQSYLSIHFDDVEQRLFVVAAADVAVAAIPFVWLELP